MSSVSSSAKRLRQNIKCRAFNRMRKSRVRTSENLLDQLIKAGDKTAVLNGLNKCYSELDKAAKNGVIHKNKADRKKQRLAARVAKMA
jgi:small subunit ribosomal protein S20